MVLASTPHSNTTASSAASSVLGKKSLASCTVTPRSCCKDDPWSQSNIDAVIDLWELDEQEEILLYDFQRKVRDIDHHLNEPHTLVRFMLGPQGYGPAEKNFRKMIQWRKDNQVDELLSNYQPDPCLLEYASPLAFLKDYDRDGDPIYIERGGAIDAPGLLKRYSQEDLMRHAIWLREVQSDGDWVDDYERRQGHAIKDITVVYDLEGLSMRHYTPSVLTWFQSHMQMTDENYPGPIKRIIVLRAPSIFRLMWNTIKVFLPRNMRDRMIFTNDDNYLEELDKWIDIDVLPKCINPNGHGETAMGMPKSLVAGRIPAHIGKNGAGHVVSEAATVQPIPTPPSALKKQLSEQGSHHTEVTTCSLSEEDEYDDDRYSSWEHDLSYEWEEMIFSESHQSTNQVHVLWQESTGVEISHKHIDDGRNLIFI